MILDDRASRGRTLIEKFEKHAEVAKYAVVLLTGDDVGGAQGEWPAMRTSGHVPGRTRCSSLGFSSADSDANVTVLYELPVEKPSDVEGLAYVRSPVIGSGCLYAS